MNKITIFENGIWIGNGSYYNGNIIDCCAILGPDDFVISVYQKIEEAIRSNNNTVSIGNYTWSWIIEDNK